MTNTHPDGTHIVSGVEDCQSLVSSGDLGICLDCRTEWHKADRIQCDCWKAEAKRQQEIDDEKNLELEDEDNERRSPECPNWR